MQARRSLLAALLAIVLLLPMAPSDAQGADAPLAIRGNDDLLAQAAAHHWPGAGTPTSPYVIGPLDILANTAHGVVLQNTSRYVTLKGIAVSGGKSGGFDGIRLEGASNVVVDDADLSFDDTCVLLAPFSDGTTTTFANHVTIKGSTLRACNTGARFERANNVTVVDDSISVNDQDVRLTQSSDNTFTRANLSIATGQTGFFFADEASYNNSIDATNVVNFVPVRWYVATKGTPASPFVIPDNDVRLRGITNVAQIMCYRCTNVTILHPRADLGDASGVAIVRGSNVSVVGGSMEANKGAGLLVLDASRINVSGTTMSGNAPGLQLTGGANHTVADVTVRDSALAGIAVANVVDSTFRGVSVSASARDGILLQSVSRVGVSGANASANAGRGISVAVGVNVTVADSLALGNTGAGVGADGKNLTVLRVNASTDRAQGVVVSGTALGSRNLVQDVDAWGNAGAGIQVDSGLATTVTGSRVGGNVGAGILVTGGASAINVSGNTARGNVAAGVWLSSVGAGVRVQQNTIESTTAGVKLTRAQNDVLDANVVTLGATGFGFVFDDEPSYENDVRSTNTVNGAPVWWFIALAGTTQAPVTVSGLHVTEANVTNVGQVMLYKSSYVSVRDVTVANGVKGLFVLKSSSINVSGSSASGSAVGIEFRSSQSIGVDDVQIERDATGILIADTTNATISNVVAAGTKNAVVFADASSKNGIVQAIDATGLTGSPIVDPSFSPGPPPRGDHILVDAGLDKVVSVGQNVSFGDAVVTARASTDAIVSQRWDFGDGESAEGDGSAILRPTHVFATPDDYAPVLTLVTASGTHYTDRVQVHVYGPAPAPLEIRGEANETVVNLSWTPPTSKLPVLSYHLYRGANDSNLTLLATLPGDAVNFTDAAPLAGGGWYALASVTFLGEGTRSDAVHVGPYVPPAPTPTAPPLTAPEPTAPSVEPTFDASPIEPLNDTTPATTPKIPAPGILALLAALGAAGLLLRRR